MSGNPPGVAMTSARSAIAVVDDDAAVCDSTRFLLETYDFVVHTYRSGADFLRDNPVIACLILDYHMPGDTGSHLYESFRRNNATKTTPILFMSGEADPSQIMAEISDSTGSRFLPKPVKLDEFRRTIREMLAENKEK